MMANYINHFQKPSEETKHKNLQAPNEIIDEHSLSDKVKGVAHSARKIFHHHVGQNHADKPVGICGGALKAEKKKNCVSRMINHMKKKNKVRSIHAPDTSETNTDSDTDA